MASCYDTCLHYSPHFLSSHARVVISHRHKKRVRTAQSDIFRKGDHIHNPFISVFCDRSILLLVIAVNLLLGLMYKLNFIIGMYE